MTYLVEVSSTDTAKQSVRQMWSIDARTRETAKEGVLAILRPFIKKGESATVINITKVGPAICIATSKSTDKPQYEFHA